MSELQIYTERPGKIWALIPKPGYDTFEGVRAAIREQDEVVNSMPGITSPLFTETREINGANLNQFLRLCVLGLAHVPDLAERRARHAFDTPRESRDRLYDTSLSEPGYILGPLAVIAFTAANEGQTEEWLAEGFLGDVVEPEIRKLPMLYPPIFGVDEGDRAALDAMLSEWYPTPSAT